MFGSSQVRARPFKGFLRYWSVQDTILLYRDGTRLRLGVKLHTLWVVRVVI